MKEDLQELQGLVEQKEEEWRNLSQVHIQALEKALGEKEKELKLETIRFKKLKEDFEYNLKLIADRDVELSRYEKVFEELKAADVVRNAELSEAKILADQARIEVRHAEAEKEELRRHYQARIADFQKQADDFYSKKSDEVNQERSEYEQLKQTLLQQTRDLEDERCLQQQQMALEYEDACQKQSKEHKAALEIKDELIHAQSVKMKMLSREVAVLRDQAQLSTQQTDQVQKELSTLSKQLKEKEWHFEDSEAIKNSQIKELDDKIEQLQRISKQKEEEHLRLRAELDRSCKQKDKSLSALKQAADEREENLKSELKSFRANTAKREEQARKVLWDLTDKLKERDEAIKSMRSQLASMKCEHAKQVEISTEELVARDISIQKAEEEKQLALSNSEALRADLERYKKDLALSLDREKIIQKTCTQLELDWKKRYNELENSQFHRKEELIAGITKARDEALALVKQRDADLKQRDKFISDIKREKDGAVRLLESKGIPFSLDSIPERDATISKKEASSETEAALRSQNAQLRQVIQQMRADVENLNAQLTAVRAAETQSPFKAEKAYVSDLEEQVRHLKSCNHGLMSRVEDLERNVASIKKPPVHPASSDLGLSQIPVKDLQTSYKENRLRTSAPPIKERKKSETNITSMPLSENVPRKHLEAALEKIKDLMTEREQLLRVGNRLKAELSRKEARPTSPPSPHQSRLDSYEVQSQPVSSSTNSNLHKDLQTSSSVRVNTNHAYTNSSFRPGPLPRPSSMPSKSASLRLTSSSEHSSLQEVWGLLEQSGISLDTSVPQRARRDART